MHWSHKKSIPNSIQDKRNKNSKKVSSPKIPSLHVQSQLQMQFWRIFSILDLQHPKRVTNNFLNLIYGISAAKTPQRSCAKKSERAHDTSPPFETSNPHTSGIPKIQKTGHFQGHIQYHLQLWKMKISQINWTSPDSKLLSRGCHCFPTSSMRQHKQPSKY